jgi:SOS-response transcriptional repressor LexA
MWDKKYIGKLIRAHRDILGWSQEELALKCGWENNGGGRVSNYENGSRAPSLADLERISKAFDVGLKDFLFESPTATQDIAHTMAGITPFATLYELRSIPILDSKTAQLGKEAIKEFMQNNTVIKRVMMMPKKETTENVFGVDIQGDAMISDNPYVRSFVEGEIIVVDPTLEPTHSQIVIAAIRNHPEIVCRKYVIEGGQPYLVPYNKQWANTLVNEDVKICGVVVASMNINYFAL